MKNSLSLIITFVCVVSLTLSADAEKGTWAQTYQFSAGLTLLSIAAGSPNHVWTVGLNEATASNQIFASTDGGSSWVRQHSGMNLAVFMMDVDFADQYCGWVAGGKVIGFPAEGVGAFTYDGGATWSAIPMLSALAMFQSVYVLDNQHIYMPGFWSFAGNEGIRYSINGGTTWVAQTVTTQSSVRYCYFINPQVGWMTAGTWPDSDDDYIEKVQEDGSVKCFYKYRRYEHDVITYEIPCDVPVKRRADDYILEVYRTTDAGHTWTQQYYDEGNYYPNDLYFKNQNEGWVAAEANLTSALLHTTDGGATWQTVHFASGNQHGLTDVLFVSDTEGWAFGMGYGSGNPQTAILHTLDGGQIWARENVFIPSGIMYGDFIDQHRGWTAGGNNMKVSRSIRYDDGFYNTSPTPTPLPGTPTATNTPGPSATPPPWTETAVPPTETPVETAVPPSSTPEPTPTTIPTPPIGNGIHLVTNALNYSPGDEFFLYATLINNEGFGVAVDEYIVLDIYSQYYFWPSWTLELDSVPTYLSPGYELEDLILHFFWPVAGSIENITFWGALLHQDTTDLFGEVCSCSFDFLN